MVLEATAICFTWRFKTVALKGIAGHPAALMNDPSINPNQGGEP
jgi:hypothetical protein